MKAIRLLPLAYLADVHGFIYFVPYMLFVLVIAHMLAISRKRAGKVGRDTAPVPSSMVAEDTADVAFGIVRN